MFDDLARDVHLLLKADSLIGRIWLNAMARRFGLKVFAGLIAVFGLGMTNVAGFYALQPLVGPIWAAAIVAVADFVLAAILILMARNSQPGPEIELALDVRKMAIEAIQADARDLKQTVDGLGQQIRDTRNAIAGFAQNPLDAAAHKLLIPAALSLIKGLRARKEKA
jgi:hypothetical protein